MHCVKEAAPCIVIGGYSHVGDYFHDATTVLRITCSSKYVGVVFTDYKLPCGHENAVPIIILVSYASSYTLATSLHVHGLQTANWLQQPAGGVMEVK